MLHFNATVDKYDFGKYYYTGIYIPDTVAKQLPLAQNPRLRVSVTINNCTHTGALIPDKLGSQQTKHLGQTSEQQNKRIWFAMLPKRFLSACNLALHDKVKVQLRIANQDEVIIPHKVEELLHGNSRLAEMWSKLSVGKKRSLVAPIHSAKTKETLEKRLLEFESLLIDQG